MRTIFITLLLFSSQLLANENTGNAGYIDNGVEEVLAIGIRPGPELWKVTKDDNTLWILGTLSPLPKKMVWHSQLVEAVLEESQVLILPPTATAKIGFFKQLLLAPSIIGIRKNPEDQMLKDVMPDTLYSRWVVLKEKYIGRNKKVEKMRPIFAADKLFQEATNKMGLISDKAVRKKVRKMAKKNKLELITPQITLDIKKPKTVIKKFKKTEMSDIDCFTKTMDRLEVDLEAMRLRANAWAMGDITKIKTLTYPDQNKACGTAFLNSDVVQETGMASLPSRLRDAWIAEVKKSLSENKSTFAMLPITSLVGSENYLALLASEGYLIDVPK